MEANLIQEKQINLTGSETTKPNEGDSASKEDNPKNDNHIENRNEPYYQNGGEKMRRHRRRNSEITQRGKPLSTFYRPTACRQCFIP